MNIPKEIRTGLYLLLLIFNVQLAGNGVLTITVFENQNLYMTAAVIFGISTSSSPQRACTPPTGSTSGSITPGLPRGEGGQCDERPTQKNRK